MRRYLYVVLFLTGFFSYSYAQETVTGVVKDAPGQTIPGATVVLKGTARYAATDLDGKFSIPAPDDFPFI